MDVLADLYIVVPLSQVTMESTKNNDVPWLTGISTWRRSNSHRSNKNIFTVDSDVFPSHPPFSSISVSIVSIYLDH